jgi:hypothetical protein
VFDVLVIASSNAGEQMAAGIATHFAGMVSVALVYRAGQTETLQPVADGALPPALERDKTDRWWRRWRIH